MDYQVMRLAFESQADLGRLCDEVIYQHDLAARAAAAGFAVVRTEVPVTVRHEDFEKIYYLDLLIGDAFIYELKVQRTLVPECETQLLNYLYLEGVQHGKLVNFRPNRVESRFVNTSLTQQTRREFYVETSRWESHDEQSRKLHTTMLALLSDWGAFLELSLYVEALIHFFGGEKNVVQMVALSRGHVRLGNQRLEMLTPNIAFRLTALTEDMSAYEGQLRSLLRHSPLERIQWINLCHHNIQFVTLTK